MCDDSRLYTLAIYAERLHIRILRCSFGGDLERLLSVREIDFDAVEKGSRSHQGRGQS